MIIGQAMRFLLVLGEAKIDDNIDQGSH